MRLWRKARGFAACAVASVGIGLAAGIAYALLAGGETSAFTAERLANYLQSGATGGQSAFWEAFAKHLRVGFAVWLLGFWPKMSRLGYVLCAGKTAAFGFALALFGRAYGVWGVQKALVLTGIQQLLLLSVIACVAAGCRLYASRQMNMKAYALLGAGMVAVAAIVAAMDAFVWRTFL